MIPLERFAIQKFLLILQPQEDIVNWVLFTLKLNWFVEAKLLETIISKTHSLSFTSLREVIQVGTLSAQLGLGSEEVDWYRDAMFFAYRFMLNDLSPLTDDRLRFLYRHWIHFFKKLHTERLKHLKSLDDEQTKSLYFRNVPIMITQMQNLFLPSCPKEFIRFLCESIVDLLKKTCRALKDIRWKKFQALIAFSHKNNLVAEKRHFGVRICYNS